MNNKKNRRKIENIIKEPLTRHRFVLNGKIRDAQTEDENKTFNLEDLKKFVSGINSRDPEFKKEILNMLEAIQFGDIPQKPQFNTPEKQLIWGAGLAYLKINPEAKLKWTKPAETEDSIKSTNLWKQIRNNKVVADELLSHAHHVREALRDKDTKYDWSEPGQGFAYDRKNNIINLDLMQTMIVGFEHARADVYREIGHALLSVSYPKRMQKVYKDLAPLSRKAGLASAKKGPELSKEEYKRLRMLSAEWQLRRMMFNAAEENVANKFVSNMGSQMLQDYSVSLNNTAVTHRAIGLTRVPTSGNASEELRRYMNLCNAVQLSFFQNNDLFEDTDAGWNKVGVDPSQVRKSATFNGRDAKSKYDKDGVSHADFKHLRELCGGAKGLENLQPKQHERLYGWQSLLNRVARADKDRKAIIEEIWDLYAEDLIKSILEQTNDQVDEKLEKAQEQEQQEDPNGDPQDGDPQDGDPQDGDPQDGDPQDGDPQDGDPQDGDPQDGDPQDGDPQDGKPQKGKPQKGQKGKPQGDPQDFDDFDPEDVNPDDIDNMDPDDMPDDPNEMSQEDFDKLSDEVKDKLKEKMEEMQKDAENQEGDDSSDMDGESGGDSNDTEDMDGAEGQLGENDEDSVPVEGAGDMPSVDDASEVPSDETDPSADSQDADDADSDDADGQDADGDAKTMEDLEKDSEQADADGEDADGEDADGEDADGEDADGEDADGDGKPGKPKKSDKAGKNEGKSLEELSKQDWTNYSKRVAELSGPIQRVRKIFKEIQKRQLQRKTILSPKMDILPENGEIKDRFNMEAHRDLIIKKMSGNVEENDLKRFHRDEERFTPTEIDIVIMIDGSGSMGMGGYNANASPLQSALQASAILHEAASGKDMNMNVYVGMWGNDNPPMIIKPGDDRVKIGRAMEAAKRGLHSGTSFAPAVKKVAEVIGEQRGKNGTLTGFTHVLILSDGDIFDQDKAMKNINTMFDYSDKVTFDVAIIKSSSNSSMEKMAKGVKARKPFQGVGTVIGNKANDVPMEVVGLLLDKINKCGSFIAVPNSKKRRAMRKAHNRMDKKR